MSRQLVAFLLVHATPLAFAGCTLWRAGNLRERWATMARESNNPTTLRFYERVEQQCATIATLPPLQHDAAIARLSKETGLTPITIAPIIEKYAYQRLPDYPVLATRLIEQIGRPQVRTMLATNHGMRDLKNAVQTALADERLSITGPRVALFVNAIKAEFHSAPPSELTVWGAPSEFTKSVANSLKGF